MVDKEHIKGAAEKVKGAVKETIGNATGSDRLVAEGKADKAEGAARQMIGDVKDAGRKAADAVKR
ncbi:CsbD family protein [Methylocella sp.]|uniref:CsbD family protein n=1 Tax=Methylocella sp. TaxID=1978226 RepID=UPI0035B28C40